MSHKIILRVSSDMDYNRDRYRELLQFCKEKISTIDEIIFFTQCQHAVQSFETIRKRLDFIGALMKEFRVLDVKLGLDILCTLGHNNEYIDSSFDESNCYRDENGRINLGRLCPTSEATKEYIRNIYTYAASIGPDSIHIDDDLHYVVDCRCERWRKKRLRKRHF